MAREVCFFCCGAILVDQIANYLPGAVELEQVVLEHFVLPEGLGVRVTFLHFVEVNG